MPAPLPFFSHALVLMIGFVFLVPGMAPGMATPVAATYPASSQWTPAGARNAVDFGDVRDNPPHHLPPPRLQLGSEAVLPAGGGAGTRSPYFTPPPGSNRDGLAAIYAVFNGSPGLTWALRVANCESHYNPLALNRHSGASGLFQFMPSTWNAHFASWNIWDPYAQAKAALIYYNNGQTWAWTCK